MQRLEHLWMAKCGDLKGLALKISKQRTYRHEKSHDASRGFVSDLAPISSVAGWGSWYARIRRRFPEMGVAVRAYAPVARFVGFASFVRSRLDLWVTWLYSTYQTRDVGIRRACGAMTQEL
jgi:hypothetical protein